MQNFAYENVLFCVAAANRHLLKTFLIRNRPKIGRLRATRSRNSVRSVKRLCAAHTLNSSRRSPTLSRVIFANHLPDFNHDDARRHFRAQFPAAARHRRRLDGASRSMRRQGARRSLSLFAHANASLQFCLEESGTTEKGRRRRRLTAKAADGERAGRRHRRRAADSRSDMQVAGGRRDRRQA